MLDQRPYIRIRDDDQKRLRQEFNDNNIYYGYNTHTQEFEAWYEPKSSSPYKILTADNVAHALRLMRVRLKYEQIRAKDLLAELDDHNDKLVTDKEQDAMLEVRSQLKGIACGKQHFSLRNISRKTHATV